MTASLIHPSAAIASGAELGPDVEIGAFAVIGPDVKIGKGARIHSHVVITGHTEIGEGCEVYPFAVLGARPQDMKYRGEESRLVIGASTTIREHVTMHGGTEGGGHVTRVGSHCLIMVGAHIAHDCIVGDHVILVNSATLGGHVTVEDHAILGGLSAVHQWVRIGAYSMVGGMSGVENDVIPYGRVLGNRANLAGPNILGMKRLGMDREQIHSLRKAYRLLFSAEGTLQERLDDVDKMFADDAAVQRIVSFMRAGTDRAFCTPR